MISFFFNICYNNVDILDLKEMNHEEAIKVFDTFKELDNKIDY